MSAEGQAAGLREKTPASASRSCVHENPAVSRRETTAASVLSVAKSLAVASMRAFGFSFLSDVQFLESSQRFVPEYSALKRAFHSVSRSRVMAQGTQTPLTAVGRHVRERSARMYFPSVQRRGKVSEPSCDARRCTQQGYVACPVSDIVRISTSVHKNNWCAPSPWQTRSVSGLPRRSRPGSGRSISCPGRMAWRQRVAVNDMSF